MNSEHYKSRERLTGLLRKVDLVFGKVAYGERGCKVSEVLSELTAAQGFVPVIAYGFCKGYKSALIGKILQPRYKTLFENIALFSLPLNGIFLFLQLEVIILDLDPANSFVKKDKSFFNRNNIVAFNKKKYQRPGRVALGAVFIKKTRSNPNFPLRPNGNSNLI